MKVYAVPSEIPAPEPDYDNYDYSAEEQRKKEHTEKLKAWLIDRGFTGANTGAVARFPAGDGYALYMLGEKPNGKNGSILIHLPYGDAWQYPDIEYLPKKRIMEVIERDRHWKAFVATKKALTP